MIQDMGQNRPDEGNWVRFIPGMAGQGRGVEEKPRTGWHISMQAGHVSGGRAGAELSVLSILCQVRGHLLKPMRRRGLLLENTENNP